VHFQVALCAPKPGKLSSEAMAEALPLASPTIIHSADLSADVAVGNALRWSADDKVATLGLSTIFVHNLGSGGAGFGSGEAQTWVQPPVVWPNITDVGLPVPDPLQQTPAVQFESRGYLSNWEQRKQANFLGPKGPKPEPAVFLALDWSPVLCGITAGGTGCLLLTCTSDHRVVVHGPPLQPHGKIWQAVCCLSDLLLDALKRSVMPTLTHRCDGVYYTGWGGLSRCKFRPPQALMPGAAVAKQTRGAEPNYIQRLALTSLRAVAWSKRPAEPSHPGICTWVAAGGRRTLSVFARRLAEDVPTYDAAADAAANEADIAGSFSVAAVALLPKGCGPLTALAWLDEGPCAAGGKVFAPVFVQRLCGDSDLNRLPP
jgi:hypothetical protein